jgi:hypothetical protein
MEEPNLPTGHTTYVSDQTGQGGQTIHSTKEVALGLNWGLNQQQIGFGYDHCNTLTQLLIEAKLLKLQNIDKYRCSIV